VTDRQTDGRTDGRTAFQLYIYRYSNKAAYLQSMNKSNRNTCQVPCLHGAQVLIPIHFHSNEKLGTPLSCAAYHGHDHIVSYLLGRDVSCNGSYAELKVSAVFKE